MNVNAPRLNTPSSSPIAAEAPRRSQRREREFGTGYGRSSGYADGLRRYIDNSASGRFRIH